MSTSEGGITLIGTGDPVHVRSRLVTANFFKALGARALHGRTRVCLLGIFNLLAEHSF